MVRARDDLQIIYDFIARDSPRAADSLIDRILDSAERLAEFPSSGRLIPEFPTLGYREIMVASYRVQYRVEDELIWILGWFTVADRRQCQSSFPERESWPQSGPIF